MKQLAPWLEGCGPALLCSLMHPSAMRKRFRSVEDPRNKVT